MPEFTFFAGFLGVLLALVFGAANAYLGLRVGQTVSASVPAAVISMGLLRGIFKKDSILENNLVQTIGSAGESIAGGAIFTLPVLFLWSREWGSGNPSYLMITAIALAGGLLGVLFMIPLRRALIARESEELPFPEGTACAEVLKVGEEGGSKAKVTFFGAGAGALYKIISDGLNIFPSEVNVDVKNFKGTGFGLDAMPALMGVGFIIGPKVSALMLAGAVLGWYCIMPLIYFFGSESGAVIYPGVIPIAQMTHDEIWSGYLRYIGAGAVAFGGIYSLVTSLPMILRSFRDSIADLRRTKSEGKVIRTEQDLSMRTIVLGIAAVLLFLLLFPYIPIGPFEAVLVFAFGFFFATVSARIVGIIGSSNSPVSGMTIATLLVTSIIFKAIGNTDHASMTSIISIGGIICVISAISGDTSQDLKTGYLLGATPKKQQIGEMIGVIFAAFAVGGILMLLDSAWGFGGREIPAIQATLMKMIVEGVIDGDLPWVLVISGVSIGVAIAILRLPVMPIAIGIYLPIYLSVPIMIGAAMRIPLDLRLDKPDSDKPVLLEKLESGVLYSSGLIAGEGLVGVLLALLAVLGVQISVVKEGSLFGQAFTCLAFALLGLSMLKFSLWRKGRIGVN
jgi:putative OPT family oligopeptide transporter